MKQKEIYEFVKEIVDICTKKVIEAERNGLPKDCIEYEKGRLYESGYILEEIERIIFKE